MARTAMRITTGSLLVALLGLSGCTRTEDYLEVIQGQQHALEEMSSILKKIQSPRDMAGARDELEDCYTRYEKLARKGRELPKPPPPEVAQKVDVNALNRALRDVAVEVDRVKHLDGGAEFFQQFDGRGTLFGHAD